MAALTSDEWVELTKNAITALSSPSVADDCNGVFTVSVGGRSYTREQLPILEKLHDKYKARVEARSRGPIRGGLPRVSA